MAITLPSSIGGFARAAQVGAFNSAYGRVQQQDDSAALLPTEAEIGPAVVNHVRSVGSATESGAATAEPADTPGEPPAAPGESAAAPGEPAAAPGEPAAAPGEPAAAPGESAAAPGESAGVLSESAAQGGEEVDGSTKAGSEEEENAEKIREMKKRDAEVRAHEQAHAAAGGAHAGSPSYSYERGPDGVSYAVSGEVPIDVSPISGDPDATIQKMMQVKRAALAPRDPSDADHSIAATADARIAAARQEQSKELTEPTDESTEAEAGGAAASTEAEAGGAAASTEAEAGGAAAELFSALERRAAGAAAYGAANAA